MRLCSVERPAGVAQPAALVMRNYEDIQNDLPYRKGDDIRSNHLFRFVVQQSLKQNQERKSGDSTETDILHFTSVLRLLSLHRIRPPCRH